MISKIVLLLIRFLIRFAPKFHVHIHKTQGKKEKKPVILDTKNIIPFSELDTTADQPVTVIENCYFTNLNTTLTTAISKLNEITEKK